MSIAKAAVCVAIGAGIGYALGTCRAEVDPWAALSNNSFARDWVCREDDAYDSLAVRQPHRINPEMDVQVSSPIDVKRIREIVYGSLDDALRD